MSDRPTQARVAVQGQPGLRSASVGGLPISAMPTFDVAAAYTIATGQHDLGLSFSCDGADRLRRLERASRQLARALDLVDARQGPGERAEHLGADLAGQVRREQPHRLLEHGQPLARRARDRRAARRGARAASPAARACPRSRPPPAPGRPAPGPGRPRPRACAAAAAASSSCGWSIPARCSASGTWVHSSSASSKWRWAADGADAAAAALPGPHRGGKRTREIVGGQPVMREHRARVEIGAGQLGVVLDRLRVGPVKLRALAREQILVDRRPGQRMTEAVSASGLDRPRAAAARPPRAGRRAARASGSPATIASRRSGTQRAAAETTRSTCWALGERSSARASNTSRSDGGR